MRRAIFLTVCLVALALAPAALADAVQPYGTNDYRGFRDVLPPGTNGLDNAADAGAFLSTGTRPAHDADQIPLYRDLLYAAPGLSAAQVGTYYKDSTFGVRPGDVESTSTPRPGTTIQFDHYGVPHVYGQTRYDTEFGAGYAAARDRLFLMDLLRHVGRASVASFLGGSLTYRKFDHDQWSNAPYDPGDFDRQAANLPVEFGAAGRQVATDGQAYVDGINAYIDQAKLDPLLMPAEYAAIGEPLGPATWTLSDVIACGSVIGSELGVGGGSELQWAQLLQKFRARFGRAAGTRRWSDFRDATDPEAPNTVLHKRFPYLPVPKHARKGSEAIPDRGSVRNVPIVAKTASTRSAGRLSPLGASLAGVLTDLFTRHGESNALLLSAKASATHKPIAVFGPQVSYFTPQILMEEDLHGPGIQARGAAIPGASLYVELGHGEDYAWSATSSNQDIVDVFAVPTCGGDTNHYVFRGKCLAVQRITKTNSWTPNVLDSTPAGSETLQAERTALGIVEARGKVHGRSVLFTRLRSTYLHELDSAIGFKDLNDPAKVHDAKSFQRATAKIGYAFNWFYADNRDIAYLDGGADNPVRAKHINPLLPVASRFAWKGFKPKDNTATYGSFASMPKVIDQRYIVNWNNRQAAGWTVPEAGYGPIDRSLMLEERVKAGTAHGRRMTLPQLIGAMEDAATVDLRGDRILPLLLRVIGRPPKRLAGAVRTLRAWQRTGAHRIDRNRDGVYDQAAAVRLMDAWWPRLVKAEFEPTLGPKVYAATVARQQLDNQPHNNGDHLGSAYDDGWYGYIDKDMRQALHRKVRQPLYRPYCGHGRRAACRRLLLRTLARAAKVSYDSLYAGDPGCTGKSGAALQPCWDEIRFSAASAVTQDPLPWQNRPTYQQVVAVQGHRPR